MSAVPALKAEREKAQSFLPYGRQLIEDDDIAAVTEALKSDYLTTGPLVERFERRFAAICGAKETISCFNGTAALYMAAHALGLGAGHTVIVPSITFLATASAPRLNGAEIVFADVDPESGLMRPQDLEEALARAPNGKASAVFPVHYAGQACDMESIAGVARAHDLRIVEDAAHAVGSTLLTPNGSSPIGANLYSDLTIFSFHPVKTIAMGEGGAVSTNDPTLAKKLRAVRNHGMTRAEDEFVRIDAAFDASGKANPWYYELAEPGFNFRIPDINCALGLSQLAKLDRFVVQRQRLADLYDAALAPLAPLVKPLKREAHSHAAWHIYPVRIDFAKAGIERGALMGALSADGIGSQVHYIPVHRQPYFAARYGVANLPGADAYYAQTLTLPLHAAMEESDVARVVEALAHHLGL